MLIFIFSPFEIMTGVRLLLISNNNNFIRKYIVFLVELNSFVRCGFYTFKINNYILNKNVSIPIVNKI